MKNRRNYYRILHVQPDAPSEVIRSSYRAMMQKMRLHPDLGGDDDQAAIINEAYATLTDPESRASYDRSEHCHEKFRTTRASSHKRAETEPLTRQRCSFCGVLNECDPNDSAANFCIDCQSPLFLSRQSTTEDDGRRSITRLANEQSLTIYTHWQSSERCFGKMVDVSLKGMKFQSDTALLLGQIVKIDTRTLRAVARVTRCQQRSEAWETGVQFVTLSFEQSRGSFVAEHV